MRFLSYFGIIISPNITEDISNCLMGYDSYEDPLRTLLRESGNILDFDIALDVGVGVGVIKKKDRKNFMKDFEYAKEKRPLDFPRKKAEKFKNQIMNL